MKRRKFENSISICKFNLLGTKVPKTTRTPRIDLSNLSSQIPRQNRVYRLKHLRKLETHNIPLYPRELLNSRILFIFQQTDKEMTVRKRDTKFKFQIISNSCQSVEFSSRKQADGKV